MQFSQLKRRAFISVLCCGRKAVLNLNLFSDGERVINLDAEIADRTFQPRVPKQKLDSTKVASAAVDQGRLRAAKRVRAEYVRVESNARDPFRDKPRILACRHGFAGQPTAGEQKLAGLLPGRFEVVINRLAGLLRHFKSNRKPGLCLAHRRTGERVAVRRNVFDPQGDNIAASQLAIDGEVEHRQVPCSPFDLQSGPN
jgi:hypothetical protein